MATTTRVQTLRSSVKLQRPANNSREVGEIFLNFPDRQIGAIDGSKVPYDLVAVRFFSALTDYAVGDHVWNAGNIWRCKTAVTAGAFNASQWDKGAGTPADLLASLLTVDGAGSGLDADLLDGQQGSYYAPVGSPALTGVPTAPTAAPGTSSTQIATTAFVTSVDVLKAPLADPVFTGDPRAPTPAPADNDTSIATTAYVTTAVANGTTASGLLGKILTVDGSGSGLDADLLDGQNGTYYLSLANQTGTISAAQHGNLAGGALHAAATAASAGFMLDAASDGKTYGRTNGAWTNIVGGAIVSDTAPVSPQGGQMWYESDSGNTYIWYSDADSSQWVQQNVLGTSPSGATYYSKTESDAKFISNIVRTVITSSGTYTKPAGLKFLEITCVGGGGSPAAGTATSTGQSAAGSGSGAGAVAISFLAAVDVSASFAITVGAGGSSGGAGGATTAMSLSAGGGGGGLATVAGNTALPISGGVGGTATGGNWLNANGEDGEDGWRSAHGNPVYGVSGAGGGNIMASRRGSTFTGGGVIPAAAGYIPGGGGSGGCAGASQSAWASVSGGAGRVYLTEYF